MTDIINDVKEEPKEAVPEVPVVVKAKAKIASRDKPKEEPILVLKVADQREEEPKGGPKEEPKEEPTRDEKVACSDWGKQMSAKNYKYSLGPNCNGKKQKQGGQLQCSIR